jgi:DNA-binding transcriptional regulator LsrR (DeoR family)
MEAHVVEVAEPAADLAAPLGRAAARFLADATTSRAVVGFTSWSRTLQQMAFAFPAIPRSGTRHVVEMLGDLGSPLVQHSAARATQAMAAALGAEPVFLRTPGVVATAELRAAAVRDAHVQRALRLLDGVDIAFVGVGPADVHSRLQAGDSYFTPAQLAELRAAGAVSQLNQRFLDRDGRRVETPLDELVVGSTLEQVAAAGRRVVVAGGVEKRASIAAALRGGWVDVLVTDVETARFLVTEVCAPKALASRVHHA